MGAMLCTSILSCTKKEVRVDVIPCPNNVQVSSSTVELSRIDRIVFSEGLSSDAHFLQCALRQRGFSVRVEEGVASKKNSIVLVLDAAKQKEAYLLRSSGTSVEIVGGQDGVFWGIQTLLQQIDNAGGVKIGEIEDAPRYAWRGFMLDEARHFFGEQTVKDLLDIMSYYKIIPAFLKKQS